ncbi:electron transfer flavoprotein subunit alpha/FixB family protein [Roseospira visakhapatnamensis]|uniref:Electron transfer flavoprotein subunit alpha n=1 Tax=Roseospira visakhapatnamensis TaxID=390880 RepID=A0A7W6W954_9PROT|nr:FAD-binding protein [Roseospira visakhapatnamensis]MBB4265745.1 electron transfer flavoprotein alpha subunit [Roseospira visakhapatnamensis]
MAILVIADHDNATIRQGTLATMTAARQIGGDVTVLVAGDGCRAAAEDAAKIEGVSKVLCCDNALYAHHLAEPMAALIVGIAGDFQHILAPATTAGKNVLPRVAALLDVAQVSDIAGVVDAETFVRPIYAGNAMATVKTADTPKIVTVRGASFDKVAHGSGAASVEDLAPGADPGLSSFVGQELSTSERPELTSARVVISGGRGMGSSENFHHIETLADALGGAVGASRAAVDAGYAPNDFQVGQTGKIVAPELYVAVGISGAIQHLAGMKDSKVIVAINKDEEAPIFQVADYGLVADLFQAVPDLEAELAK